ncbi:MAG: ABC transporter ATP-binding protein [Caldilineaceae bacterium]|nr:ABC transporter ATP-binding protein [Caldilineaceae bacterium]MCB0125079.1 ABC transporter ATP-binding protein [Caldilineaceae bacterium]
MREQSKPSLLETRKLTKRFGALLANDQIDLTVFGGEIHAILGENGAGKSTLMKSLYGFHQPDGGEILLHGKPTTIASPQMGRELGIGMVFQNFTLVPAMSALENIALFLPDGRRRLDFHAIRERVADLGTRYGLTIDLESRVASMDIGERQRLEILKVLLSGARILIFDEPTSVLPPQEITRFFQVLQRLREDHFAILFITHKLPEVMAVADRITILRHGAVTGHLLRAEATQASIVQLMLGKAPPVPATNGHKSPRGDLLVELQKVSVDAAEMNGRRNVQLQEIDLQLFGGEIVGVAGISGSGQRELGDALLGLLPLHSGRRCVGGQEATTWSAARIRRAGVACIPEDALQMGAVRGLTVAENMILGEQARYSSLGGLMMDWRDVRRRAVSALGNVFAANPPRLDAPVETLSGGNLQRVVVAREVARAPQLLLAYYPARGLDVANADAMRQLLLHSRNQGAGVLLFSEDLEELFQLSDRLLVLYHGRLVGELEPPAYDAQRVGHLMTGGA